MIKRRNKLLGTSAMLIGLWAPFTVQANDNDDAWLYVAGAVATYAHFNNHAYNHRDYHYTQKHQRKNQRTHHRLARRHHNRVHRHQRHMHRVHDRRNHGNYRNIGYDRHAQRHSDRYDRNKRSDRTRSGRRHS